MQELERIRKYKTNNPSLLFFELAMSYLTNLNGPIT